MRVLVTGGSGFLGGHVIPLLLSRGADVVALARSTRAAQAVTELGASVVAGDLDDAASLDTAFSGAGASTLVNLASLGFGHAPAIVHAAEAAGLDRAIFISTTAIFTKLNAPSKAIRVAAEEAITSSQLEWTILRPTMIYGAPGDRNMWRLLGLLRRSRVVPAPGRHQLHQPIHVEDLARAVADVLDHDATIGRTYDLAGPEAISLEQVIRGAGAAIGRRPVVVPVPSAAIRPALALLERFRRLPISAEQVARLTEDKAFEIAAARDDFGFAPRSFVDGIRSEADMDRR